MQFSFTVFGLDPSHYAPIARRADDLGFEGLWLSDHMIAPLRVESRYPFNESGRPPFALDAQMQDVWVTIGYLAAVTQRIKLGTSVYLLPLRRPLVTARAVAAAQNLSGGRVILGVGTGWLKEEFDVLGEDFSSRGSRTDEILDILEKLWSGRPVEYHGAYYQFPPVQFGGPPSRPIPVVFGGDARPALWRAAARGDGWHGATHGFEEVIRLRRTIEEMRAAADRSDRPFTYYVRLTPPVTGDNIRRYEDAGFEHLHLLMKGESPSAGGPTLQDRLDGLDELADAIVAAGYRLS